MNEHRYQKLCSYKHSIHNTIKFNLNLLLTGHHTLVSQINVIKTIDAIKIDAINVITFNRKCNKICP